MLRQSLCMSFSFNRASTKVQVAISCGVMRPIASRMLALELFADSKAVFSDPVYVQFPLCITEFQNAFVNVVCICDHRQ